MLNRRTFFSLPAALALTGGAGALLLSGCGGGDDQRTPPDVLRLDVATALEQLAAGELTAEVLLQSCLDQIATYESAYNAFSWLNDKALEQARAIDVKRRSGAALGALAGIPVVIKESMDHRSAPSTMGWKRLRSLSGGVDLYPQADAEVVRRLLAADAVIVGKGNIPAFSDDGTRANSSWDGPTFNAAEKALAPGASSSGVATAVCAGFALLGLGEETGGSIQNPAGAQSLVGLTPTYGLVPGQGVVPLAGSTRDVIGPIARTVKDAAIAMDVLAPASAPPGGYRAALGSAALSGKRLGLYGPGWRHSALSAETQSLYAAAGQLMKSAGAALVDDPFAGSGFADLALPGEPYDYRGTESAAHDLHQYVKGLGLSGLPGLIEIAGVSPFAPDQPLNWYAEALPVLKASLADPATVPDLSQFQALRAAYRERFLQVMNSRQLDAMVLPQRIEELPGLMDPSFIAESSVSALNIAGLPGLTVPAGRHGSNGSPFALIFIGRPNTEAQLLALGHHFESLAGARQLARLSRA